MKILKRILLATVGLIALILIVALFVNGDFKVEREITINKPKQQVFDYIKMLKNQDNFSVWAMKDPGMHKEYTGTDGTVGFVAHWDSKVVGSGEQEIKKITEGEKLESELRFLKPMKATNDAWMTTDSLSGNQTKVKWGFSGKMGYPMNVMLLFTSMDKMIGGDFEKGLSNLKGLMEK